MEYEDEGGAPINMEEQIEEATMKAESIMDSQAETIRELVDAIEGFLVGVDTKAVKLVTDWEETLANRMRALRSSVANARGTT